MGFPWNISLGYFLLPLKLKLASLLKYELSLIYFLFVLHFIIQFENVQIFKIAPHKSFHEIPKYIHVQDYYSVSSKTLNVILKGLVGKDKKHHSLI